MPMEEKMMSTNERMEREQDDALNRLAAWRTSRAGVLRVGAAQVLRGLYIGGARDAADERQLRENGIQCIVTAHDSPGTSASSSVEEKAATSQDANHHHHNHHRGYRRLRLRLADSPGADLLGHLEQVVVFVHGARMAGESVLVHCLAGVSRSAALVVGYLMVAAGCDFCTAMQHCTAARPAVNPNFGFRMQLCRFEHRGLVDARERLIELARRWRRDAEFGALFQEDVLCIRRREFRTLAPTVKMANGNGGKNHFSSSLTDNLMKAAIEGHHKRHHHHHHHHPENHYDQRLDGPSTSGQNHRTPRHYPPPPPHQRPVIYERTQPQPTVLARPQSVEITTANQKAQSKDEQQQQAKSTQRHTLAGPLDCQHFLHALQRAKYIDETPTDEEVEEENTDDYADDKNLELATTEHIPPNT